ncbi:hypothetical protein NPIL_297581 [Nephila pilipes]|uniref:Ankyrin repeat protein n=1 Tax=Nephila pilipes TaxID=299642 RepID=A0A8X6TYM4_NEPPI|nr:hypothetical protein NPIL_297581 [Nephila pilipes]
MNFGVHFMREEELLKDEIDGFFDKEIFNYLFPIKEKREGKSVYHYVLVSSDKEKVDPDKRKMIQEQFKAGSISFEEIKDYSQILYSGWGRDPLESISDKIRRAFMSGENFKLTFDNDLYNAARNCGLEEVKKLFEKKEVEEADENGWTCLHHAAYGGNPEVVGYLVNDLHFSFNVKDKICGRRPVHIAVREGHTDIVKFFLCREKIDVVDENNWTLLHYAAYGNHSEIAQFLIDAKINVHERDASGMEPIHVAAKNGCEDVIKFFLDKNIGIGIDDVDSEGRTPLHYAARKGDLEMVKFLVNKGASIYAKRKDGKEPIHVATEMGHINVVEFFLGKGISIDDVDSEGRTLLYYPTRKGDLEMVKFLVNKGGANIYAKIGDDVKFIHGPCRRTLQHL